MKRKSPLELFNHDFDSKEPFIFFDSDSGVFNKNIIINGDTLYKEGKFHHHDDLDFLINDMKVLNNHNQFKFQWHGESDEEGLEKVIIVTDDEEDISIETYTGKDADKKPEGINKDKN